jgi:hypothetical protein
MVLILNNRSPAGALWRDAATKGRGRSASVDLIRAIRLFGLIGFIGIISTPIAVLYGEEIRPHRLTAEMVRQLWSLIP